MNTIKIETLGCRLNQIESESIGKFFLDEGFLVEMLPTTAQTEKNPDVCLCILNTCTVTQKAEQKARRIIRLMLQKYENAAILVTGCYAQLEPDEIKNIDKKIAVIGAQTKARIINLPKIFKNDLITEAFSPENFACKINNQFTLIQNEKIGFPENSFTLATSSFLNHSRASLKIQDGCNNNCSYCAIHIARGHSVSIDAQIAINRVVELENQGYGEVVLTTVNIGQYKGVYKESFVNFAQLLKLLLENTSTICFRISSIYPEIVNDEFCDVIKNERVRPHFHISVQSGSDKILTTMNRAYKSELVYKACKKLREVKEDCFLACDIITGFPGETEDDFSKSLELCNACDFTWVHAFPYSERKGTLAATMKNKVPQSVSGERAKKLNEYSVESKINYINSFVGKELTAILENVRRPGAVTMNTNKFIYHAVTENFIHCEIVSDKILETKKNMKIQIIKTNEEKINKGGEIEAFAKFI